MRAQLEHHKKLLVEKGNELRACQIECLQLKTQNEFLKSRTAMSSSSPGLL